MRVEPTALVIALFVATAGVWWFAFMLNGLRRVSPSTRYGLYAAVWLAYFILVLAIAGLGAGR